MKVFTFNGENQWSEEVYVRNLFDVSVYSPYPFNMNVTLQRRTSEGKDWRDVAVFSNNFEGYDYSVVAYMYRIGVKTGEYNFGEVEVTLSSD